MTDTLIKPPQDAPEDAAPPIEDAQDATGEVEAVDRPDNPLADWLTVPDAPILPAWARNWASVRANSGAFCKVTWWHTRYHALRSPKYAVKIAGYSARGAFRGGRRLWPVLAADDHTRAVKALRAQTREKAEDEALALRYQAAHRDRTIARRWRWGAALGMATAAGVALNYASLGLQMAAGCIMCGGLTAIGWSGEAQILDHGTPPLRIDMSGQQLNDALRATGLLKQGKGDDEGPRVNCVMGPLRDGNGWAVIFDLPRGGGKTAVDVLAKRTAIAAELGVDEIQVIMSRVRAAHGGNAGRVSMWVADDDPYLAPPTTSPLEGLDTFSIWDAVPFGQDARGNRVSVPIVWQSMFFGGLPRRGKTFSQRLLTAAGLLDPYVRHYVADFKGGQDWIQMRQVAHRLVLGAEEDAILAFKALLKELLREMERRFSILRGLPTSICPEGKLTPEVVKRYNMPFVLFTVDELQEAFLAVDDQEREELINDMARIARRGPAAGFISNYASQRPDAKSVPTKLREIITIRYSTQVTDQTSSDMVLGKGKAAQGADASVLSEEHKGVGVLVTGPASFVTVKADMLETAGFNTMCSKGRALREAAGQLTGDAAHDPSAIAEASGVAISPVLSDCLTVMRHSVKMHTVDLLARLENLDEDYGDWDAERLAKELDDAGVKRTTKQVNIGGKNLAGYRREDLEAAMPAELLNAR
ncbi:cell division protein FtsK [Streptomyces sp. NBC_00035]|uniref:cell division protein FtsK n=1 Tax=Streptomyces sp. NBC_00035 TaxID=2903614 RepID=UPI0032522FFD